MRRLASVRHQPLVVFACALLVGALTTAPAQAQRHVRSFSQWYPYPIFGYPAGHFPDHVVSLRLQVTPRDAFVYVDGYAAGVVDDFDGVFQRLRLVPGPHEIVVYYPGHRTLRQNVYYNPGSTHTIRYTLEPLAPGETAEPQPVPRPMPPPPGMTPPPGAVGPAADASRAGTLALRVQPPDARVLIDGEPWQGASSPGRLVVQLEEGTHQVRVEKSGFQTFSVDIEVHAGETTSFNVSLVQ
jgi:hypothetical protein